MNEIERQNFALYQINLTFRAEEVKAYTYTRWERVRSLYYWQVWNEHYDSGV